MRRHTIIYYGRYSLNFERLHACKDNLTDFMRLDKENRPRQIEAPAETIDGIVFGYMEKGKEELPDSERFFAVRVEDVVIGNPIRLVPELHTDGKWFGPVSSQFGNESAERLLSDIIAVNPEQDLVLIAIYNKFFASAK